jgi:hypothetical protein
MVLRALLGQRFHPRGAKAVDILVEQANKFEIVINLKTAETLGSRCRQTCSRPPMR